MSTNYAKITQSYLQDTADAIRAKNGKTRTYTPEQMAYAIRELAGLPPIPTLAGTSWIMNDEIDAETFFDKKILGTTGNVNITYNFIVSQNQVWIDEETLVYDSAWESQDYRSFSITGGTDATDSTLINWFWENGTLLS